MHTLFSSPLREIKTKKAVLDSCSHTSLSKKKKKNSDLRKPAGCISISWKQNETCVKNSRQSVWACGKEEICYCCLSALCHCFSAHQLWSAWMVSQGRLQKCLPITVTAVYSGPITDINTQQHIYIKYRPTSKGKHGIGYFYPHTPFTICFQSSDLVLVLALVQFWRVWIWCSLLNWPIFTAVTFHRPTSPKDDSDQRTGDIISKRVYGLWHKITCEPLWF